MQKFPTIALFPRMSQVDHNSSAKVLLRQKNFKAAIKLSEQYDSNLPVILSHNTNNFLGGGGQSRQDFGTHTEPNLTRHLSIEARSS